MNEAAKKIVDTEKKEAGKNAKNSKINKAAEKLKRVKHIEIIVAVIAVVVMLTIYFGSRLTSRGTGAEADSPGTSAEQSDYCAKMEARLHETLSKLRGVGEVSVIINWESSVEIIIAYITTNGNNSSSSAPQLVQGGGSSKPIILKEIYPKALGVIIVCQGGDSVAVKLDIINAVSVLLNITPDKISVYPMNSGGKK